MNTGIQFNLLFHLQCEIVDCVIETSDHYTDLLFESVEGDAALEYFTHLADGAVRLSSTENFLDVGGDISLNIL